MNDFQITKYVRSRTDDELINDLKLVAKANGGKVTQEIYREYRKSVSPTIASESVICRQIGWNKALLLAGINMEKYQKNNKISEEELLEELLRLWTELGRQPTTTDLKNRKAKYPRERFSARFGSWEGALNRFVQWANEENFTLTAPSRQLSSTKRTSRDVNLRLRWLVFKRDNFCCVACGKSPAIHAGTELNADHIVPYAKGGETVFENLQTLCQKCNLGKGDLM